MKKRNTIQKQIIINAVKLLANHPTAEEVYNHVVKECPAISKSTVYRNLKEMAELGEIKRVQLSSEADRYDHNLHNHYHVKCTLCNEVHDLNLNIIQDLEKINNSIKEFDIIDYDVTFKGICLKCKKRTKELID